MTDSGQPISKSISRRTEVLVLLVVVLLAGVVVYFELFPSTLSGLGNSGTSSRYWLCGSPITASEISAGNKSSPIQADYDEQTFFNFNHDFTSLAYNVTVVSQNDSFGFGPAYLLNGVTNKDYWYQVGVSYNWDRNISQSYFNGFRFQYEVFNENNTSIFPQSGGSGSVKFNGDIQNGDILLLTLNLTQTDVMMTAFDWNTDATQQTSYPSMNATEFIPSFNATSVYFDTGVLLEWYHVNPLQCSHSKVIFSSSSVHQQNVTVCIDEWNFSNVPYADWFSNKSTSIVYSRCVLFNGENPTTLWPYAYATVNISTNDHEYIVS